jgi:hypothetical protein
MHILFWLSAFLGLWQASSTLRIERSVLLNNDRSFICTPEQTVTIQAGGAGIQAVSIELDISMSEQEWMQLQQSRRAPIVFKWFRFSGARLFITNVSQDANANSRNTITRSGNRIIYRANATNDRITSGTWVIKPVYANNEAILINGKELTYQFRVP